MIDPLKTSGLLTLAILASGCVLTDPTDPYAGMASYDAPRYAGAPLSSSPAASVAQEPRAVRDSLTLEDAIRIALASNPELAATAREVDAASASQRVATAQRLPDLRAFGAYTRFLDSQRLVPATGNAEPGAFSRNLVHGGLGLSYLLFSGGRITSEIQAAELLQKSAENRLVRTREELVFAVSSVFFGILAQRKVIESLEFSSKALEEHRKRIKDLIAVRKAAAVDQLRTEVRMADLAQRRVQEANVMAIQERVLANLLGLGSRERSVEPAGELALVPAAIPEVGPAVQRALRHRSDHGAAKAAVEAQARAVDVARASHWPTVAFQGVYGGRWGFDPTERPEDTDILRDVGSVGLVLDFPLFEGGRIEANVQRERAKLAAALERLRRLELEIRLDVETAALNVGAAGQRVAAMQKAIEQARESLRIEREKYDLGKGAIVDVLDAQSAMLDAETSYYRALADHSIALAQWRLAMEES